MESENDRAGLVYFNPWPWPTEWDKRGKHSRHRQLEIAGALIAAEIDRLRRAGAGEGAELMARYFAARARALVKARLREIAREMELPIRERNEMRALLQSLVRRGERRSPRSLRDEKLEHEPKTPGPGRARPSSSGGRRKAGAPLVAEAEAWGPQKIGGGSIQPPFSAGADGVRPALEAVARLARCYAGPLDLSFIARTLAERGESRMTAGEVEELLTRHGGEKFNRTPSGKWSPKK